MMIKIFTLNKNHKIELTEKELKELLDSAYWEGYTQNNKTYTYTSPNWTPYITTCASDHITLTSNNAVTSNTITANTGEQL